MPMDGKTQACGFLEQLSTEQLRELLRTGLESMEDGDEEQTFRILEVIEKRERNNPSGPSVDVGQAWEDFQKYFNTPDGAGRSLYPMRDSNLTAFGQKQDGLSERKQRRLVKRLLPFAAVVAVVLSSMVAAQAMGMDVFGALARWTDETFHFVTGTDAAAPEVENLRQAVQGAFDGCGVTIPAPAWYPPDTVLAKDIDIIEESDNLTVSCEFKYGNKVFFIVVQQYYDVDRIPGYTFEKDALNVEKYSSNGRLFYIISNLSESYATYSNEKTILVINGKISSEVLKQIIDSIGE